MPSIGATIPRFPEEELFFSTEWRKRQAINNLVSTVFVPVVGEAFDMRLAAEMARAEAANKLRKDNRQMRVAARLAKKEEAQQARAKAHKESMGRKTPKGSSR